MADEVRTRKLCILSSLIDIIAATLSISGLVIWWRKRTARVLRARRTAPLIGLRAGDRAVVPAE